MRPILVVREVVSVLDVFTSKRPGLVLKDVSDATGFPTSTCARILYTLADCGILERRGDEYRISLTVLRWAGVALRTFDLVGLLTPIMGHLQHATGKTAAIFVRQGDTRTCVAVALSREAVTWQCPVGLTTPLHLGSGGWAILAFDEDALAAVQALGYRRVRVTDETVGSLQDLDEGSESVRAAGVTESHEELEAGVAGASAVVVGDAGGMLCSIGVNGPGERFTDEDMARYVPRVFEAAHETSKLMGVEFPVPEGGPGGRRSP